MVLFYEIEFWMGNQFKHLGTYNQSEGCISVSFLLRFVVSLRFIFGSKINSKLREKSIRKQMRKSTKQTRSNIEINGTGDSGHIRS